MKALEDIKTANGSFVIFAAQPNLPHDVMQFFIENEIQFKVLLGSYNGERETSYCVPEKFLPQIIQAGLLSEQESVLVLGQFQATGYREATIVFLNGQDAEKAGFFINVPKEEALHSVGWSFDPMNDKFFTIRTAAELVSEALPDDK